MDKAFWSVSLIEDKQKPAELRAGLFYSSWSVFMVGAVWQVEQEARCLPNMSSNVISDKVRSRCLRKPLALCSLL